MKYILKFLSVIILLSFLTSCGTASNITRGIWKAENVSWETYKIVEVGDCKNSTGEKFNFNITKMLKQSIDSALKSKGYSTRQDASENQPDIISAESEIIYYIPGDAGTRWLLGGFSGMAEGAITELVVRTKLFDKSGKKILADFVTEAEISSDLFGGPDGDKKIINDVAISIANDIGTFIAIKR